jgi:hypothetical protein
MHLNNPSGRIATLALLVLVAVESRADLAFAKGDAGRTIMEKVNHRSRGPHARLQLEMTLHDLGRQETFQKHILLERKRYGESYRSAYWITAPEHERRIGLLLSEDLSPIGMWMYFPATRQTSSIATRGFPALGSDFDCEDLLEQVPLSSFKFHLLGRVKENGIAIAEIEMVPATDRLRAELGFSKSIGWVREDIGMIERAEYYDDQGTIFKRFAAEQIKKVHGIWTAHLLSMENLRAHHRTEVRVLDADYLLAIPDAIFSPDALGDGFETAVSADNE